ncbi:MAG: 1-acyl-sn-glycerol-3-phosphate acyltransferase [Bacteroidales bacterium]|nr:1-acyl-sn-glycerol-3-phosphate acyltransferase [Bacteroidales bacterium]
MDEFEGISPYTDEEAVEALRRVSNHPAIPVISKYLFPDMPLGTFRNLIRSVNSIDEFQQTVMSRVVAAVVEKTSAGFTFSGIEHLQELGGAKFLAVSNHRDIILDPALTQWMLLRSDIPMTEICVGSNLLSGRIVEDLLRSNRMIKVIRGISARELYLSSQLLSRYIRQAVTTGRSSVWIAQREGRTKNGLDITEQGLLKMFDMSGEADFKSNFMALNIVPMSISYEYEPCDARKARELLISRTQKYVKKKNEDMHSILTGIRQQKGHIHLEIGAPLTEEEIGRASWYDKNDRYQAIRRAVDDRIVNGYKLWKTNYMGYDLMNGTSRYSDRYTPEDLEAFKAYTEHKLEKLEKRLDRAELRDIFWHIYGNPVVAREG